VVRELAPAKLISTIHIVASLSMSNSIKWITHVRDKCIPRHMLARANSR